jgi:predicted DNA-binding helix-hairpin-helix protein
MPFIRPTPNVQDKLAMLATDAQYDLACACATSATGHRRRSAEDKWLYPVAMPGGGRTILFKTLMTNVCSNDCRYCPLRAERDPPRTTLTPEETALAFVNYLRAGKAFGVFLSSGVIGTPDNTMDRLTATAELLRRQHAFRGYIHLKIIPGASDAAIEKAVSLASAVSLNIETAGEQHFSRLSARKNYLADIIHPLQVISRLTAPGARYSRVKQTTQFVVGASDETDREMVHYTGGLYRKLGLDRVYFSAYQRGLGAPDLPGEHSDASNADLLMREHRLYQVDFLLRKYGFSAEEIPFDARDRLSLTCDPKEHWARLHPEFFPVDVNRADRQALLRVPGLGLVAAERILTRRTGRARLRSMTDIGNPAHGLLRKASGYLRF